MYYGPALMVDNKSELFHGECWAQSIRATSGEFPFYPGTDEAIFPSDFVLLDNGDSQRLGQVHAIYRDYRKAQAIPGSWLLIVCPVVTRERLSQEMNAQLPSGPPNDLFMIEDVKLKVLVEQVVSQSQMKFADMDDITVTSNIRLVKGIANRKYAQCRSSSIRNRILGEAEIQSYGRDYLQSSLVKRGLKRILSVPGVMFLDAFGLYRNMYRYVVGCYWTPANLDATSRKKTVNHFTLTLGPFGSALTDITDCLSPASKALGSGIDMVLTNGESVFVTSFLLAVTGDMPQQLANVGVRSHKAAVSCRYCIVDARERSNMDYNVHKMLRFETQAEQASLSIYFTTAQG